MIMDKRKTNISFKKNELNLKRDFGAWLLVIPSVFLLYLCVWRPMFMGASMAFYDMKGYTRETFVGLENFRTVFRDANFIRVLGNTCQYVLWSLLLGYFPPVILAIMLNEVLHMKKAMNFCVYLPSIIPGIVTAMMWYLLYYPDTSGLLNMILSLIGIEPLQWLQNSKHTIMLISVSMAWGGIGSTAIFYLASLQGINQELYEAAVIDGAGVFKRAVHITIPQISGVMLLFLVRQIIGVFQVMEQPLTMTGGGPDYASTSIALQQYRYGFVYFQVGNAMALGLITFLILIVLTALYMYLQKKQS